jgi:hypothetical protein
VRTSWRSDLSGSWRRGTPQSVARRTLRSEGSGSGGNVKTAQRTCWGVCIPLRGRIFLRRTLLCPSRSHQSRRRLSRIPSREARRRGAEICSAVSVS